jgi:hypothetical protein
MFAGGAGSGRAQLAVQLQIPGETFLLYEAVPVTVTIRNSSGRSILLESHEVPAAGQMMGTDAVTVPGGSAVKRTVDLLPLYALRQRGSYRVQATVRGGGTEVASGQVRFTILNGRELWSQVVGLPPEEGKAEEYRTYSLVSRRVGREDLLYVLVRDEPHELVYGLIGVGTYLFTGDPTALVDKAGHLHVLFQNGPRSFGYVHIEPGAKILERMAYADFLSRPELIVADGEVRVRGGEQTYPRPARLVSDEPAPSPQPAPKPKRKWWWPFSPRKTSSAGS